MNSLSPRLSRFAVVWVALLAASFAARAHAEEAYDKSYAVSGRADVHVTVRDGSVGVITSDSPQVEFHLKYEGYTLGKNLFIESRQEGDRVDLTQRLHQGITFGGSHRWVTVEVRMPRNADLQLETGDGNIELASLNGRITVRSGDGRLHASQLSGTVDLHTGDGAITADRLKGDLRLSTGDGGIDATDLDGKCEVSSGDGRIRLAGRFDALDIRSGDGSVTARVASGSNISSGWKIGTGDGPVDLSLPKDFKANLDASTSDGRISLGMPVTVEGTVTPAKVRGTMNGGGPTLLIHSGDGSIRIEGN